MTHEEFRAIRKRLGLTQAQMAALVGYNRPPSISDIETGATAITPMLERLLLAYEAGYRPADWPVTKGPA